MHYRPDQVVWELTMACNLRCKHCGSACGPRLPDELTSDEALDLCDDLADLGAPLVTLSGGEPLLRPDWPALASHLTAKGVTANMISNGWLLDEQTVEHARASRLANIAVSLDGVEGTHDFFRGSGSFSRAVGALSTLGSMHFPSSAITTLMRRNLRELRGLRDLLVGSGVRTWQLQLGSPMGSFVEHRSEAIRPADVLPTLDLIHAIHEAGGIKVFLADCLGYYTKTSEALRSAHAPSSATWVGCAAGRFALGIRHNGDICGCNSLRDERYLEGNIRETPLRELWERPGAFAWNRERTRESLTGFCRRCQFADACLGGCTCSRITLCDSETENQYCAHRLTMEGLFPGIEAIASVDVLLERAAQAVELRLLELADRCLARALSLSPENAAALEQAGHVAFQLMDYAQCRDLNERALRIRPHSAYALKGLGLALVKLGNTEEGIATLRRSLPLCTSEFMDPYHDLAAVLLEQGRTDEAHRVLEEGYKLEESFRERAVELRRAHDREAPPPTSRPPLPAKDGTALGGARV